MNNQLTNLQRKRKALLVLPLLIIPFLTMAFWAMGGGKTENPIGKGKDEGLNLELPNAQLSDDKDKTKLSFYEAQEKTNNSTADSLVDFSFHPEKTLTGVSAANADKPDYDYDPTPPGSFSTIDPNEAKVYRKLEELNKVLATQTSQVKKEKTAGVERKEMDVETGDVDRLANMMGSAQAKKDPDPEMEQLNSMMEKILDIQHPERVQDKTREKSPQNRKGVYAVSPYQREVRASLLGPNAGRDTLKQHNLFFDERSRSEEPSTLSNTITAVVQADQTLTNGATVKLRLVSDIFIAGILIPKGNFVFGLAALEEDRLKIMVSGIRYKDNLLPVSLSVYDLDGLPGVHIPGSISRDVAKGSAEQSLQSIGMMSLDPSLKAQATAAAIGAAKGLLSRKAKLVRVTLKSGYQVFLKDGNVQQ